MGDVGIASAEYPGARAGDGGVAVGGNGEFYDVCECGSSRPLCWAGTDGAAIGHEYPRPAEHRARRKQTGPNSVVYGELERGTGKQPADSSVIKQRNGKSSTSSSSVTGPLRDH